jgi:sulfate adenylyltransferase
MSYPLTAHGGTLVDLLLKGDDLKKLKEESAEFPSLTLSLRQLCDVEMLLNGGFSPLTGFMTEEQYNKVVVDLHLPNGLLWSMPITLDVTKEFAEKTKLGDKIALRDYEGSLIAVITVTDLWVPDKRKEAEHVFGSPDDECHPSIEYLFREAGSHYIGGPLQGAQLPVYYDFVDNRYTPAALREKIKGLCWNKVVAFQTRNPMHRSHRELTLMAAKDAHANILIHPVVGMTKPGDVDHYTRVRCYKEIMNYYPPEMATLSLLPLAMRMAGPREALWHALIRKNYGATHFIVGRDHAGPGNNKDGQPFYDPYAAQHIVDKYKDELGIQILKYSQVAYIEDIAEYRSEDDIPQGARVLNISGTELRRRLFMGIDIPDWFSYPSVVKILRQRHPPRAQQGFTLFFTGFSGSGKSTIANAVRIALMEEGSRTVTLLDGDEVRQNLSSELGFSKEHREINIRRISYVASEITKARGVAITAAIAPYRSTRDYARRIISEHGGFMEIHISTSLDVCESRDRKGLYAKARKGILKNFTGIDDPYEPPLKPEITIDTSTVSIRQAVHNIKLYLEQEGFLASVKA